MCQCKKCMMKQQQPKWEEPIWAPAPEKFEQWGQPVAPKFEQWGQPAPKKFEHQPVAPKFEQWGQPVPFHKPEPCHIPEPCDVIVVYEEPVICCEEVFHYHKVEHIVPVMVKKVINDVYKHEYIVETEEKVEHHREDVGIRHENWCDVVGCQGGGGHKKHWC